jgi:hypothetical protein
MTDRRDIDPEQAAQITERIGQTFNFVRDAIANPRMLEEIPSGSMLRFRDVFSEGQRIRLTAFLPKQPGAQWDRNGVGNDSRALGGSRATAAIDPSRAIPKRCRLRNR